LTLFTFSSFFSLLKLMQACTSLYKQKKVSCRFTDTELINRKIYPLLQRMTQELNKWVDKMLEQGFISISSSNYRSPTFTVTKKDGSQRIVQDFRELNKYIVKDITLLPDIKHTIEGLGNKVLFTKFDVREGYNNIQIILEDHWKTGFKTYRGLFKFNVMPFGLCNAPGTFTRGLGSDIQPMYKEFPTNHFKYYMDDCLITTGEGEVDLHRKMVYKMLEIFKEKSYFLKPLKCEFKKEEVDFLGACLGHSEVTIKPIKLGGITDWPIELHNIKDIRSTLGVLGF
jgi:Reverse transcriptase (RNA-dependent DNA polymerase)